MNILIRISELRVIKMENTKFKKELYTINTSVNIN
jgi:hypothetical protein